MDYQKDIKIDDSALDIEWLGQAELMLKYAQHSAKMRMELDKTKQDLDIAKAESDKEIRNNFNKSGEKFTETVVANAILIHPNYKLAYETYLTAKYEADMAQAAVNAFEQRKSALENLVRLFGQQYFAGPSMPRNLRQEREEKEQRQKEVNAGINSKLKRGR
jgi:hypothetical protein